jgi:predicted TIM-barrel fold metal-dependent hydrolase
MSDVKIFSADSHAPEGDMLSKYMDNDFQFRAPRIETRERAGKPQDFYILEGFPPIEVPDVPEGERAAARFRARAEGGVNTTFRGWDPVERLKDQDTDRVVGEVIHTNNLGFRLFWLTDASLQRACFRAYNDWLADYCSPDPNRLVGVPLLAVYDIEDAIAELHRTHKRNLRGAMIPLSPPMACPPYTSTAYDRLWAAAQELDTPLILHAITGGGYETPLWWTSWWREDFSLGMIIRPHEAQRVLAQFILSGVLERFPRLKLISAENGTDWIPWYVGRLERAARGPFSYPTRLSLKPIEYFLRNVYFSYIDEPHVVANRHLLGPDKLMFATDYPHRQSTWPNSMHVAQRDTGALPAEVSRALIYDNVIKAFNITSQALP